MVDRIKAGGADSRFIDIPVDTEAGIPDTTRVLIGMVGSIILMLGNGFVIVRETGAGAFMFTPVEIIGIFGVMDIFVTGASK